MRFRSALAATGGGPLVRTRLATPVDPAREGHGPRGANPRRSGRAAKRSATSGHDRTRRVEAVRDAAEEGFYAAQVRGFLAATNLVHNSRLSNHEPAPKGNG